MNEIRRGEIFYIARGGATNGSEQFADRPAVVVSNDENNKHSGVIERMQRQQVRGTSTTHLRQYISRASHTRIL